MTSEGEELHSDPNWCRSSSSELLQSRFWLEKVRRETEGEEEDLWCVSEMQTSTHLQHQEKTRSGQDADGERDEGQEGGWTHLPLLLSGAVTEQLPPAGRTATPRVPRGRYRSLKRKAAVRELWVL